MTDKKISIKWIEAILLIVILLAGLGIGTFPSSLIESEREIMRPREEAYIRNAQLPLRQSELSISQAELSTLRSKIMDQQVESVKQSAKLESLKVGYPALNTIKDLAADTILKPEVKMAFTQTQFDLDSTQRILNDLNARLPAATETAVQKAIDLSAAQESVHRDFERATQALACALESSYCFIRPSPHDRDAASIACGQDCTNLFGYSPLIWLD